MASMGLDSWRPYRGIEVITIDIDGAQLGGTTSAAMDTVITG